MIAKGRGSICLAGAASMKYRVPASGRFPYLEFSSVAEQQPDKLWVAGSTPVIPTNLVNE
jgi:hypothetical protein